MDQFLQDLVKTFLPSLIAVAGTLGGVYVAQRHMRRHAREVKALEFTERRVRDFYSPMVGCFKRIHTLSSLRAEVSRTADVTWRGMCARAPKPFLEHEKAYEPFKAITEFDNEQLYAEILPAYDRMVAIFTEQYWLADAETQRHYVGFCRFVDIWHRYKAHSIPPAVLLELTHSTEAVDTLYSTLERKLREYTDQVANGGLS